MFSLNFSFLRTTASDDITKPKEYKPPQFTCQDAKDYLDNVEKFMKSLSSAQSKIQIGIDKEHGTISDFAMSAFYRNAASECLIDAAIMVTRFEAPIKYIEKYADASIPPEIKASLRRIDQTLTKYLNKLGIDENTPERPRVPCNYFKPLTTTKPTRTDTQQP